MGIRKFLVGLEAFVLLVWGPAKYQLAYVVLVPVATWFLLKWFWQVWQPDIRKQDRLMRTIAGAVAGGLFVGAYLATQQKYHVECTQEVRSIDGTECVGDYERVSGPDFGEAFVLTIAGAFALTFGVRESEEERALPSQEADY